MYYIYVYIYSLEKMLSICQTENTAHILHVFRCRLVFTMKTTFQNNCAYIKFLMQVTFSRELEKSFSIANRTILKKENFLMFE